MEKVDVVPRDPLAAIIPTTCEYLSPTYGVRPALAYVGGILWLFQWMLE